MKEALTSIVRVRLTDEEKVAWQEAAGGVRKMSAWVRSTCNDSLRSGVEQSVARQSHTLEVVGSSPAPAFCDEGPEYIEPDIPIRGDEAGSTLTAATDSEEVAGPRPAVVPNEKPQIVADAISREVTPDFKEPSHRATRSLRGTSKRGGVASTQRGSSPVQAGGEITDCPRWMHHRPGTYCGSCKKVMPR